MDKLKGTLDYQSSGVDIVAGEKAVQAIKTKVRSTYNRNVLSDLGSFGGLYQLDKTTWQQPVLVSSTDGVGTKLRVAIMAKEYRTIGQDLVNHCVNDILVQGAIPQFFLDYIGVGKLHPEMIEAVIDGLIAACKENACALIGGEMAEMPGIYQSDDFDLAGTIVGIVEKDLLLPRKSLGVGDILIALPSNGLHTNGYSLVRKLVFEQLKLQLDSFIGDCSATLGELLLQIHRSYLPLLKNWLPDPALHGLAHITGGGISGNLKRILPEGTEAVVELARKNIPPLFGWLQSSGKLSETVMEQTFNLGVGMVCALSKDVVDGFLQIPGSWILGEIVSGVSRKVRVNFV